MEMGFVEANRSLLIWSLRWRTCRENSVLAGSEWLTHCRLYHLLDVRSLHGAPHFHLHIPRVCLGLCDHSSATDLLEQRAPLRELFFFIPTLKLTLRSPSIAGNFYEFS